MRTDRTTTPGIRTITATPGIEVRPIGGGKWRLFITVGGVPFHSVATFADAMAAQDARALIFATLAGGGVQAPRPGGMHRWLGGRAG